MLNLKLNKDATNTTRVKKKYGTESDWEKSKGEFKSLD